MKRDSITLSRILFGQTHYDPRPLLQALFRVMNIWMVYNLVLALSAFLPHRRIPWLSWVNCSLYFLLFLLSFRIWKQEKYNRDIFFFLTLSYLVIASSFLLIFVGKGALIPNQRLAIVAYVESVLFIECTLAMALVFVALKYRFPHAKTRMLAAAAFAIVGLAFAFLFGPRLVPSHIFYAALPRYYRQLFYFNLVPLAAVVFYLGGLLRSDRILGEYITALMAVYLVRTILNGVSLGGAVFGIRLFEVDQYFLSASLLLLVIVLFRKLSYALSPFGQYYEDLIHGRGGLRRVNVTRRSPALSLSLYGFVRLYLSRRVHVVGLGTVAVVGLFQSLPLPLFVRLNLIAVVLVTVSLYVFFYVLHLKRSKSGYLLPHSKEAP